MNANIRTWTRVALFTLAALTMSHRANASEFNLEPLCEGELHYENGEYEEALADLVEAQNADPEDPEARLYRGLTEARLGNPRSADSSLQWAQHLSRNKRLAIDIDRARKTIVREGLRRLARQMFRGSNAQARASVDPGLLAILPFQNLASPGLTDLGKAIAVLMTAHLHSADPSLRIVDRDEVHAVIGELPPGVANLGEKAVATQVARALGAGQVTAGAYFGTDLDSPLQLQATLIDASRAEPLRTGSVQGPTTELQNVLVRIIEQLLGSRDDDDATAPPPLSRSKLRRIARSHHPANFEALDEFARAINFLAAGDTTNARAAFQRSLENDPQFHLAREQLKALDADVPLRSEEAAMKALENAADPISALRTRCAQAFWASATPYFVGAGIVAGGAGIGIAASGGGGGGGGEAMGTQGSPLGAPCLSPTECVDADQCTQAGAAQSSNCCNNPQNSCSTGSEFGDQQCCGEVPCTGGTCCIPTFSQTTCTANNDCCSQNCDIPPGICCLGVGQSCNPTNDECCQNQGLFCDSQTLVCEVNPSNQ